MQYQEEGIDWKCKIDIKCQSKDGKVFLGDFHTSDSGRRHRDVLLEYHRAVVPFSRAVRPVRTLST